jgi:putative membrane protein
MKIRAKDFFSRAEKESIRRAVEAAETGTSGEIMVMLVSESDPYREAQLVGALSLAGLAALVLSFSLHYVTIWFYIPAFCLLLFPSLYLFQHIPHLKLAFLHKRRIEDAVRARAIYGFYQKGAHRTEDETGVFIFISLLERKVWILGDKGIDGKIGDDFWRSLTRELTEGIKGDRATEALLGVIEKCGAELARHFPGRAGMKKHLTDEVVF